MGSVSTDANPTSGVEEVTSLKEFHKIIKSRNVAIFDFSADFCAPCQIISPIFETLSEQKEFENIEFYKVIVNDGCKIVDILSEVGITAFPTFIAYRKGGKEIDRMIGANRTLLEEFIRDAMAAALKASQDDEAELVPETSDVEPMEPTVPTTE